MTDAASKLTAVERWMASVSGTEWIWYAKYLSANDTNAKRNVHQAGPYVSKGLLASAFAGLERRAGSERNPDLTVPVSIDSHGVPLDLRLVWYNSRRLGQANGRDEARLTNWGGRESPILEPDATGSLTIFAFRVRPGQDADALRIWRTRAAAEEDAILARVGDVEPGRGVLINPSGLSIPAEDRGSCALTDADIPPEWKADFPSGEAIVDWVLRHRDYSHRPVDVRLLDRRKCEYDVFLSVEQYHALPGVSTGFSNIDAFVTYANSLVNRRKSRSGRSLELQLRTILDEESVPYAWGMQTEGNRLPDFIFPSVEAYRDNQRPNAGLRMLAAKTTCKDRWRQILNEAARVPVKHLLTLQEGVSVPQHAEMRECGVKLVVPEPLMKSYPDEIVPELTSLAAFIAEVKRECA